MAKLSVVSKKIFPAQDWNYPGVILWIGGLSETFGVVDLAPSSALARGRTLTARYRKIEDVDQTRFEYRFLTERVLIDAQFEAYRNGHGQKIVRIEMPPYRATYIHEQAAIFTQETEINPETTLDLVLRKSLKPAHGETDHAATLLAFLHLKLSGKDA